MPAVGGIWGQISFKTCSSPPPVFIRISTGCTVAAAFRRNRNLNIDRHCYGTCGPQTNKSFNTESGSNQDLTLESVWIQHLKAWTLHEDLRKRKDTVVDSEAQLHWTLILNSEQPSSSNIWHLNRSSLYAVVSDISHRDWRPDCLDQTLISRLWFIGNVKILSS